MKRTHISDVWNLPNRGHANFDFVDIAVNDDTKLFIDPCLMKKAKDPIVRRSNKKVDSFFDAFYSAYRTDNIGLKRELLSHAREENGTKLGYGNGFNGRGNTTNGILQKFKSLEKLIASIQNISEPEDLPVLLPGFAEDGLSDLLTNVIHEELSDFTFQQMRKYGITTDDKVTLYSWSGNLGKWEKLQKHAFFYKNKEILLVPKSIVRKKYLFSTAQFFNRVILEHLREEGNFRDINGNFYPKSVVMKSIQSQRASEDRHWLYSETINNVKSNNWMLDEYHNKLGLFYLENGDAMSDTDLDSEVYYDN